MAGWLYMLSAENGKRLAELKLGENLNSTPVVIGGRIYIGAFNGKLYCLATKGGDWQEQAGFVR